MIPLIKLHHPQYVIILHHSNFLNFSYRCVRNIILIKTTDNILHVLVIHVIAQWLRDNITFQFSAPQIEYALGGSSKKGSHVYFMLQIFWVILLFDINVVLMLPWWSDVTIVQSDITIVPWQLSTGSKHGYLFYYCHLVAIWFEVLRIFSCVKHCTMFK